MNDNPMRPDLTLLRESYPPPVREPIYARSFNPDEITAVHLYNAGVTAALSKSGRRFNFGVEYVVLLNIQDTITALFKVDDAGDLEALVQGVPPELRKTTLVRVTQNGVERTLTSLTLSDGQVLDLTANLAGTLAWLTILPHITQPSESFSMAEQNPTEI